MLRLIAMTSRPTVLAAAVLALALLGDSLLYAVLPLHAATFGVSLAWVGVLLSANRITRLFVYQHLARLAQRMGLRRFTIAMAVIGAASTLAFAAASGPWRLLAARIAWGIAFGSLSLAALGYATEGTRGAGKRVGLSLSLREIGPLVALTGGVALVAALGVRPALAAMGGISLIAIPLARLLPRSEQRAFDGAVLREPIRHARREEVVSAALGFVADGVFPATVGLLLAPAAGVRGAMLAAGTMLALKRIAVVVLSPISGRAADRFGALAINTAGILVTAAGALVIASGTSGGVGALLLISGAAVTATALPLAIAISDAADRMPRLARLGLARDAGAAAGPLVALALVDALGLPLLYGAAGILLLAVAVAARRQPKHGGQSSFGFGVSAGFAHSSRSGVVTLANDGSPPPPQSTGQLVEVSPQDLTHWPSPQRPQRAAATGAGGGTGAGAKSFVDRQSAGQVRSFSHEGAQ